MQLNPLRPSAQRDEAGASTAEYATTCGVGIGFAGLLFKALTSEPGRAVIETILGRLSGLLPF